MRKAGILVVLSAILLLPPSQQISFPPNGGGTVVHADTTERILQSFESAGGYFVENRGQVNDLVRYYSTGNPAVAFRDDGVMFMLVRHAADDVQLRNDSPTLGHRQMGPATGAKTAQSLAYMIRFEGAHPVSPVGRDRFPFNSNFFLGREPVEWRTDVPNFGEVIYEGLYDGIDMVYGHSSGSVKYEFVVHPGADPSIIQTRFDGVESMLPEQGGIAVTTALGEIQDAAPYSYTEDGHEVDCRFDTRGEFSYGFKCNGLDASKSLVIDPPVTLAYSTYLGGTGSDDNGYGIAVDASGYAFVAGETDSIDFPVTPGAYDTTYNGVFGDAFVVKLNAAGSSLMYSTFIGGSDDDVAVPLAIDTSGCAYVGGITYSSDFPITPGAFDATLDGTPDAFFAKLNAGGNALYYSTYLGGSSDDSAVDAAVDWTGSAYIIGTTISPDFPTTVGAMNETYGGQMDAFVTKLNPSGSALIYSTYIGGSDGENGESIAVDRFGNAYVTGNTQSSNFPVTPGANDTTFNGRADVFVMKLNASGSGPVFSTFLGGSDYDFGDSIAVDFYGNAYVAGVTEGWDYPTTPGAFGESFNGGFDDYFVTKLNASGSSLDYSTYLGGDGMDTTGGDTVVDFGGSVYTIGATFSNNFPVTPDANQPTRNGNWDVFVTRLSPDGSGLVYSSYLGGSQEDDCRGVAIDFSGRIYVVGMTDSSDFPTTLGAFDTHFDWGDAFVTKIGTSGSPGGPPDLTVYPDRIFFNPPSPVDLATTVDVRAEVRNIGASNATMVRVRFYDGLPSISDQIGPEKIIGFLPHGWMELASVSWVADLPAGIHEICVVVDPENNITELNENNNQACAPIEVVVPPIPDLSVSPSDISFSPSPPQAEGSVIRINVTVWNVGGADSVATNARFFDGVPPSLQIGSDQTLPPIPVNGSANVSVTWTASPPGTHEICIVADPDNIVAELDETNNMACAQIEVLTSPDYVLVNAQPASPLTVGLSMRIELSLEVLNAGGSMPNSATTIAFFNGTTPSSPMFVWVLAPIPAGATIGPYAMDWTSPANPGTYFVTAHLDILDQVDESDETNNLHTWTIEVVAGPITSLVIGNPNYTATVTCVKSSTPLDFSVVDQSGQGILNTTYRIDGGDWRNYTATGQFFLAGEGQHEIEWYSIDRAGNVEGFTATNITVDDAPPATVILPAEDEVESGTSFTLTATDSGCGVDVTMYRVDGSDPVEYVGGFTLAQGVHGIYYYSVDHLGNTEAENHALVTVKGPTEVAMNYKPIVALTFAIVLLIAGVWSSKRKPWKGGKDGMAVMKAFTIFSMPFVLLEAATGIDSSLTGSLSIPPFVGAGTAVDLGVLLAGIAILLLRGMRSGTTRTE